MVMLHDFGFHNVIEQRHYNTTSRAFPFSPLLSYVDEVRLECPTFSSDSGSGHVLRVTKTIPHTIKLMTVKMRQMRVGSKVIIQLQKAPASKIKHSWGPCYSHWFTSISVGISNHITSGGWNYLSIPKLQGWSCWSLEMDNSFHSTRYWTRD